MINSLKDANFLWSFMVVAGLQIGQCFGSRQFKPAMMRSVKSL